MHQGLRMRKLRVIYRDILCNLKQMDVQCSIRPGNNNVQRDLYAIESFVITVVDLGGIKTKGRRAKTQLPEQQPGLSVEIQLKGRDRRVHGKQQDRVAIADSFCSNDLQLMEGLLNVDRELQIGVQLGAFDVRLRHVANRAGRRSDPSVLTVEYRGAISRGQMDDHRLSRR